MGLGIIICSSLSLSFTVTWHLEKSLRDDALASHAAHLLMIGCSRRAAPGLHVYICALRVSETLTLMRAHERHESHQSSYCNTVSS